MRRRFTEVRLHHPRRDRAARRMRAAGWPVWAIARALLMSRPRVEAALKAKRPGSTLWDAKHRALFREAV
jgi:hypothetical protein